MVSKKSRKKLSMSSRKPTPPHAAKEGTCMVQRNPSPPPKMRVRSSLQDPGREKLISGQGHEYPLQQKYNLDEVVTDQMPDKMDYTIVRAYLQLRQEKPFNVDLPAYFIPRNFYMVLSEGSYIKILPQEEL